MMSLILLISDLHHGHAWRIRAWIVYVVFCLESIYMLISLLVGVSGA